MWPSLSPVSTLQCPSLCSFGMCGWLVANPFSVTSFLNIVSLLVLQWNWPVFTDAALRAELKRWRVYLLVFFLHLPEGSERRESVHLILPPPRCFQVASILLFQMHRFFEVLKQQTLSTAPSSEYHQPISSHSLCLGWLESLFPFFFTIYSGWFLLIQYLLRDNLSNPFGCLIVFWPHLALVIFSLTLSHYQNPQF